MISAVPTSLNLNRMNYRELVSYRNSLKRRMIQRRRAVMAAFTLVLVMLVVLSFNLISDAHSAANNDTKFKYFKAVTVESNDTLWNIADEYFDCEEYDSVNDLIDEIQTINHIEDAEAICAGQTIIVPYYSYSFK